jgi:hypothetical protein
VEDKVPSRCCLTRAAQREFVARAVQNIAPYLIADRP